MFYIYSSRVPPSNSGRETRIILFYFPFCIISKNNDIYVFYKIFSSLYKHEISQDKSSNKLFLRTSWLTRLKSAAHASTSHNVEDSCQKKFRIAANHPTT